MEKGVVLDCSVRQHGKFDCTAGLRSRHIFRRSEHPNLRQTPVADVTGCAHQCRSGSVWYAEFAVATRGKRTAADCALGHGRNGNECLDGGNC